MEENIEKIEDFENIENTEEKKKVIRHIVLSGGGTAGLSFYGLLRESNKNGLWDIQNIQSIYGTSVGSIFGVMISLGFDWDTLDDYIIKRPWHQLYKVNIQSIFSAFQTKGLFDVKIVEETLSPLFKAKDLSIDITLRELFEFTKIDLHVFAINLGNFKDVDFSYKSHPDWRVVDAVYCSCSLPILLQPFICDNICYSDGGFVNNYPISNCIHNGADPDEILGICRSKITGNANNDILPQNSNLFDYIILIFLKTIEKVLNNGPEIYITHEYFIHCPPLSVTDIYNTASSMEERIRLIQVGVDTFLRGTNSGEPRFPRTPPPLGGGDI